MVKPWVFTIFLFVISILPGLTVRVAGASAGATVFVYPDKITVGINSTFQIFINVSGAQSLQGFDFMLTYNSTLLNCSSIDEGSLLPQFGPTFVVKREINNSLAPSLGRIWFVDVIYGTGCTDGTNGSIAAITFKALTKGETVLDLFSNNPLREDTVKLTTCPGEPIPNAAIDGLVTVDPPSENSDPSPIEGVGAQSVLARVDLNGDGVVNIEDLTTVAVAYGRVKGDEKYVVKADVDQNGVIDIRDVALVAHYYMRR